MYKILPKVLANRIKRVLSSIIDEQQSAFLEVWLMLHSVRVVNEIIDEAKRYKKPTIFFKVDFEKAYDSVCWHYLLYMLHRMGFNDKWVRWIKECLSSSKVSLLINGSLSEEFPLKHGLRQSDPVAPFLFMVVAQGLTGLMCEAEKRKIFTGVSVGLHNMQVIPCFLVRLEVCLVNSVLTALPLYYISFFKVPGSVSREIISIQRKFLWGCNDGQRKVYCINWDKVTLPKAQGGLGVKNVTLFNTAMLAK
uniref:Retrovirus-related Pol polyprotein LINE-1 n=1 Tax=Cajanus cajan TaxID=3821 RepID=A0A151U7D7_CAJCA|nr:Retrovirus-related Pol polyprotein LINE-1 [Cajanus cajan]